MRIMLVIVVFWLMFAHFMGAKFLEEHQAALQKHEAQIETLLINLRATQQNQMAIIEALRVELSPEQFTPLVTWKEVKR